MLGGGYPEVPGAPSEVWAVHCQPSHHRKVPAWRGSAYQPGGVPVACAGPPNAMAAGRDLLRPTGIRIASSEKGTPIHPTGVKIPKAPQKNAHREHHLIQKTLALLRAAMPPSVLQNLPPGRPSP